MASFTEDLALAAKARRTRERPVDAPFTAESVTAKAMKGARNQPADMPWSTVDGAPTDAANIQNDQVPVRLAARAAALAKALRRAAKDDDGTGGDDVAMAAKAVWSTAYVNDLPDDAFLHVEAGGKKDDEGKTTPRSLRHFPVRDTDGNPDVAHVRNAVGRIPQSSLPAEVKATCSDTAEKLLGKLTDAAEKAMWTGDLAESAKALNIDVHAIRKETFGEVVRAHADEPELTERGKIAVGKDNRVGKAADYPFQAVQDALDTALRARYPRPPGSDSWMDDPCVRDVYDDHVVYRYQGKLWCCLYVYDGATATLGATPYMVRVSYLPVQSV